MDFSYLTVLPRGRQIYDYAVFPPEEYDSRKTKLNKILDKTGLDGLMVYSDALTRRYVNYMTNYTNSVAWSCCVMLVTRDKILRLVSSVAARDITYNLKSLAPNIELNGIGLSLLTNYKVADKTIEYLNKNGLQNLKWGGVNIESLCLDGQRPIYEAYPELPDCTAIYDEILSEKSPAELSAIVQAASMAKKAVMDYLRMAVPGENEREIAARIDRHFRIYGAANIAVLVSAGKDKALCLRQPTDYVIQEGDTISAHVEVNYLNYHGMFGASMYRGKPDGARQAFYDSAEKEYKAVLKQLKSGKTFAEVCAVGKDGYAFAQGIGGDTTEAPYCGSEASLKDGTAFALTLSRECEVYGGIIISDTFAFAEDCVQSLGGPGFNKVAFYG